MPDNRGENNFQSGGMILREYPPLIFLESTFQRDWKECEQKNNKNWNNYF